MRVLFAMNTMSGYFRQFEPAIREMLARGHQVHVARRRDDPMRSFEWLEALASEAPGLTWERMPRELGHDPNRALRLLLRRIRDYVRYRDPAFDDSPYLQRRARQIAPLDVLRLMERPRFPLRDARSVRRAHAAVAACERHLPPLPAVEQYFRAQQPDVVALTPHLMPGLLHQDHVTAARHAGLPTVLCVASWDNLSSKQLITCDPDLTLVWNEIQRREAIHGHGLRPDRVEMTGAQVYDQWFDWPPRERAEFCARVGLPADRPYVLYLAGALYPAEMTEAEHALRWLRALRESNDPRLREAGVLLRPHPKRYDEWKGVDLAGLGPVALWPLEGRMPVGREAKQDFFDSLHHAAAAVGINTSAMIEAGIAGRRVLAMLVPEFEDSQLGTPHFRYLCEVGGGLLRLSRGFEEHLADLARTVAGEGDPVAENRGFLEAFVRPHGLEMSATSRFVDAIERAAAAGPQTPTRMHPTVGVVHAARRVRHRWREARMTPAERRKRQRRHERQEERWLAKQARREDVAEQPLTETAPAPVGDSVAAEPPRSDARS
jgi:hypothetical protein